MKSKMGLKTGMVIGMVAGTGGLGLRAAQDKRRTTLQIPEERSRPTRSSCCGQHGVDGVGGEGFLAVYDAYQKDLEAINQRTVKLIESYAADYRGNTLTDERQKACG